MLKKKLIAQALAFLFFGVLSPSCNIFAAQVAENLYDQLNFDTDFGQAPPEKISQMNQRTLRRLLKRPIPTSEKPSLNYEEVRRLFVESLRHKVVSPDQLEKYDPLGNIGFCFGRATYFHLELLQMNVAKDSIRKLWMVGPMQEGNEFWQFHVATAVRAENGDWWVLDPLLPNVVHLEDWYRYFFKWSTDGLLRLYETDPQRFGASAANYDREALRDGFYNNFFEDMFKEFKKRRRKLKLKNPGSCQQLFVQRASPLQLLNISQ